MGWTYTQVCAVCVCFCVQVSSTPPPGYVKPKETDQHPPKYEFGYDVKDGRGGGQGHLETREGEYALGKYYVNLPSNEQKVDYFADDWGFHPLVEYKTSSGSSSMSTQFALGEKAVAALSRQYGVAPPLEILKTKVASSLVAGMGAQVSLPASSGIIPGPSAEPVPNSLLEGDTYSPSSTASPSIPHGASPSSLGYESTSEVNNQYISEVSTVAPVTRYSSTTVNYPSTVTPSEGYRESYEKQRQGTYQNGLSGGYSSTTENYGLTASGGDASEGRYQVNSGNSYYESESSGRGYASSTSSISSPNRETSYSASPGGPYSSVGSETYSQTSSSSASQNGHQITAYLADSNSAVDVTSKGSSHGLPGLPGVTDYSPNTRISAVLVAEGGNRFDENDIRSEYNSYVSSTTPKPPKTLLKPIIITENRGASSNLALFSTHGFFNDQFHENKIGKLYHRENKFKNLGLYTTASSSGSSTINSLDVDDKEIYSTPSPTHEPVLVTPRGESYRLTSSENILAPIQAALSISANHNGENCNLNSAYGSEQESTPVSGPDVEKQELREDAVYKTTVDIQKSIPFEISAEDDQRSQEQYKTSGEIQQTSGEVQSGYEESSQENYQQNIHSEYSQNIVASNQHQEQQEHFEQNGNALNSQVVQYFGGETNENTRNTYDQNVQLGQPNEHYQPQQYQYQDSKETQDYSDNQNVNQQNNNFIQQVLFAYHKMANSRPSLPENEAYTTGTPVPNQPLFVPNRLYYVYMQRYNPYVNRYGTLYTNYRPSGAQEPTNTNYQTNDEEAGRNIANYNVQANGESQHGLGIINVANVNANNVYANSGGQYNSEAAQYISQIVQEQRNQANYEHNEAVNALQSGAVKYESSQQAAQEYAAQLNSLGNQAGGVLHPNVEYSTGQGAEGQVTSYAQHQEGINAHGSDIKYIDSNGNEVNQNNNIFSQPQYIERTKLVEVEKPVHISHPVPIEYTKVIATPVPVAHPIPVPQTQYVERPVPVPQPIPVEVTRVIEKQVPVPHPIPIEYTKVISVEKPVAIPHPVPYPVTKLVAVDRPVAYPHPVPVPYAVPHPVGVPVPHLVPYHNLVPIPVKDYRPAAAYFYRKPTSGRLLHRESQSHHGKNIAFRPSQPVFASQYPPQTYSVMGYFKNPYSKARGQARKLCIEYGGFKPPMVPSVQVDEEPKPAYGPPAEDKKD